MKYEEYQIWYHTYNKAISALLRSNDDATVEQLIATASMVADAAIKKLQEVEDVPQRPNIDINSLVNRVVNEAQKKK